MTTLVILLLVGIVIYLLWTRKEPRKPAPDLYSQLDVETPTKTYSGERSKNDITPSDITPEDFLLWKQKKIPSEYLYPQKNLEDCSSFFYDKKVCISGEFEYFPSRTELAKHLWECGADIDTSVGKKLDILIAGDGVGPSKLKKAESQGTYIMPEDELVEKLNGFKSRFV